MRKTIRNGWKRVCSLVLAAAMVITMLPAYAKAGTSSDNGDGTFDNPVVYADVPDIDIIRVDDAYYMVSTTMHLSPGCPIMKSTDLVNWEIVNYVYDILGDTDAMNLRNGQEMYGNGQWAASLQYHNGTFYVAFNSNTTGKAYIYTTKDIERGAWTKTELNGSFHDLALFFDDASGKAYLLYGGGQIKCAELSEDLSEVKKDTEQILFDITKETWNVPNIGTGLVGEGTHIMKKGEYYYVFNICWPTGSGRTELCHRSKTFPSTQWENEVILQANFQNNGVGGGVAQGGVIDTVDGKWYGFLFQDHGAIGRVPVLTDCTWKNDWPMLGKDGDGKTVEAVMNLPVSGSDTKSLAKSDEFYNDAEHRVFDAEQAKKEEEAAQLELYADAKAGEVEMETVDLVKNGNFEDSAKYWSGFENGEIKVTADDGNTANHVLHVYNRKNLASSGMYDLSGKLEKGKTYKIKAKIKYTTGPATRGFNVVFQNGKDWQYRTAAKGMTATKGQWCEFSFDYTPSDKVDGDKTFEFSTAENYMFFETSYANPVVAENDLMDYYLDDVSVTYERPVSSGGESENLIQLFKNGDVETGTTEGWTTTPGEVCSIEATNTEKANGEYSIYVKDRNGTGAGACQDISGKLVWGKTYKISGKLKYTVGPDTKKFIVTIQNGPDYQYRDNVFNINAVKGEWVDFEGTYTPRDKSDEFPFDPEKNFIFVENGWTAAQDPTNDRMNYYLDDFSMTTTDDNIIRNGSFEDGLENWSGMENAKLSLSTDEAQEGSQSVAVTERSACAQGPSQDLSNKLTPGKKYLIEGWVKYNTGVDEKQFNITIQNGPDYTYRTNLAHATAKKGEWTKISTEWMMPEDAITTQNYLFFETPWAQNPTAEVDLMDFFVDNVSMVEKFEDPKEPAESGEHDYNGSNLDLVWQWNHNPNNLYWSLTDRDGWLRLTTGNKSTSILNARNTLTQRTYGPTCAGSIKMDISNMKSGDVAGLAAFSYNYGYIAVKKENAGAKLVMVDASGNEAAKEDKPTIKASVDCTENIVYLKEEFNFAGNQDGSDKDTVSFYYSFDGKEWKKLGEAVKLSYELTHFMGSKFAIFNYATKTTGGYVDYDYFRVSDQITGTEQPTAAWKANLEATQEVSGVVGSECEVKLKLDELTAANHSGIKASISIPNNMRVEDVIFNNMAIKGETDYSYKNSRLTLTVKGSDVSFNAEDKLFATIKLKVSNYVDEDKSVDIKADYIMVDNGAAEYDVSECSASVTMKYLNTKTLAKKLGYGNPITTHEFGADPYAIEYQGRVYVYMTADDYQYDDNGEVISNDFNYITSLRVVSSTDLVNWTDHGEIDVAGQNGGKGPAMWASHSWAPAIAYQKVDGKDKFFLYFANDASGIGVLEADTPLGPWKDPIGKALLTRQTPGCAGVTWCFDPAVLVDDDGSAYIYFGGGVPNNGANGEQLNPKTARVAKLGADMISIEGEAKEIDAPCMFEDSGIFKYDGKYYYSYCSNFIGPHGDGYPGLGNICYMVSDNPMGPFTYAGEIFSNPSVWFNVGGNNHHATFVYEGVSYFIYHAQTVSKALGVELGYRSTHIDEIKMNSDGSIKQIKGTYAGIPQLRDMTPYERIDAETIAWNAGVKAKVCAEPGKLFSDYNMALTDLQNGDWTSVAQLNFGEKGAAKFQVSAASAKGGKIEVRLDSPEGTLIGEVEVPATGGEDTYKQVECEVDNVTGTKNVFLVFRGSETENIMNVDYYQFTESESIPIENQIEDKISEAQKLLGKLSDTEKAKLQAEIDAVKELLKKDGVTQEELEQALEKLTQAVKDAENSTKGPIDEQINDKIKEAEELLGKLSEEEKAKLQAEIDAVKELLKKDGVTQEELEQALEKLTQAVKDAQESTKPLDEQLNDKLAEAEKLLEKLSEEEKAKLQAEIDAVKELLKKDGVTQEELEKALEQLKKAVKDAEETTKPLDEQINNKLAEAEKLLEKLSATEKAKLQAEIDAVKALLKKDGVTQEELEAALQKLKQAVKDAEGSLDAPSQPVVNDIFTASNGLKYKVTAYSATSKKVTVIGATKQLTSVTIPDTVKYKDVSFKVTAVGSNALANQANLKSVVIGKYVTSIGTKAFYNDKKLAKVTFKGTAVKTIGKDAFKNIVKNAAFVMPTSTFTSSKLKYKITKSTASTKQVTVTGTSAKLTSVTVPATVTYNGMSFKVTAIGNNAFAKKSTIKSAVIGKYVTKIGSKAFYNDKKLAKVTFKGTAVKTIGKNAFKGISKKAVFSMKKTFTSKKLKYKITKCTASVKQVTVTGTSARLTSVNVPATVKYNGMTFKVTAIANKAFKNQRNLKSAVVGKNIKSIGSEAFFGAKKLAKIKFSGTAIKTIGKNAFKSIKKNAVFTVNKSKKAFYKKLLIKAKTKNFKIK